MLKRIICSGLGGQGVLTLGMILAHAAAAEGKYVTWVPSYSSEMRGGSANCKIKISDDPIGSPYVKKIDILVALDEGSLGQFADQVQPGGCIVVNSSIIENIPEYPDKEIIKIPANDIAEKLENPKGTSLAIVGAIIAHSQLISYDVASEAIKEYFAAKKINVEKNEEVFNAGYHYVHGS